MTTYLTSRRLALAVGGLLAALSFGGVAQAVTDKIFTYSVAKTGHFSIDTMAMIPDSTNTASNYSNNWIVGITTSAGGCFNTGVNLPHGARMTRLKVWLSSGTEGNPEVFLYRRQMLDGAEDTIATAVFADDSSTRKPKNTAIATTATAVVDNAHYTYGFGVCMDNGGDTFHAARITYTFTHAGD